MMEGKGSTRSQSQVIHESEASFIAAGIFNERSCVDHDGKSGHCTLNGKLEKDEESAESFTKSGPCEEGKFEANGVDEGHIYVQSREDSNKALNKYFTRDNYTTEKERVDNGKTMYASYNSPERGDCVQRCSCAPDEVPSVFLKAKRFEVILEEKEVKEGNVQNGNCKLRPQPFKHRNNEVTTWSSKHKSNTGVEAVVESLYAKKMQEIRSKKGKLKDEKVRLVRTDDGMKTLRSNLREEALEERPPESHLEDRKGEKIEAERAISVAVNVATQVRSNATSLKEIAVNKEMATKANAIKRSPVSSRMHRKVPGEAKSVVTLRLGNDKSQNSTQSNAIECHDHQNFAKNKVCHKETLMSTQDEEKRDEKANLSVETQVKECKEGESPVGDRKISRTLLERVEVIDQSNGRKNCRDTITGSIVKSDINGNVVARQASADSSKPSEVYLILPHAVECKGAKCNNRDCYIANQFILHVSACYQQSKGGCQICIAMDAMVCKHAKVCSVPLHESCPIPSCNKVKVKVLEQWMKLKMRHNELMQKAFEIKVHARTCRGDCCYGKSCKTMKKIILHVNKCQKEDSCPTRQFLASVCMSHKETCSKDSCPIDICRNGNDCASQVQSPDDGDKENLHPVRKLNFSYTLKTGKVEVADSNITKKDEKEKKREVILDSEEAPPKVSVTNFASEEREFHTAASTFQVLSGHLSSTAVGYENFSFFSNVYHPDSRPRISTQSQTITTQSHTIRSSASLALNNKIETQGTSVHEVELSQKKPNTLDKNIRQRSSAVCKSSAEDTFPADERGVSLLKPVASSDEGQRNELELCSPLSEAEKFQEANSKKHESGYRLYSLWPDPASSLPTFSPTEIQKILRVSSHDLNESSNIVMESETVEDILNLKDIDVSLPEKTLYSHCLDERRKKAEPGKQRKSAEKINVLTTPDSTDHKTRFPYKRHCVRRLFPLD